MEKTNLTAQKRTLTGKQTKRLRKNSIIPAVLFEHLEESINIQVAAKDFDKIYRSAGHSTLIDIELEGKKQKVLIAEVQFDPRTNSYAHVMFHKVNLKEEINAEVPLELVGEAPAVKVEKAIIVTPLDTLEIRCLPSDLPSKIEIDISSIASIGDSITVGDIKLPKGVELLHSDDTEQVVVTASAPQKEEEVETEVVAPDEIALSVEKGKKEEQEENK